MLDWRIWAAVVALVCGLTTATTAAPPPPSVILVLVDTLRADYLGCYGFDGEISPNLDRLCKQSVVFTQCHSQAPWTKPSIATLFTSLDPLGHNVLTHKGQYADPEAAIGKDGEQDTDVLPGWTETIAEVYRSAGYATAAFVANPWIRGAVGFGQGFDTFEDKFAANATSAEVIIDAATAWLDRRAAQKPFFLYLHFMDVHDPYVAPEADFESVREAAGLGKDRKLAQTQLSKGLLRGLRRVGGGGWARDDQPERLRLRTWRARYAAGVRAFDRHFQAFVDYLARTRLADETVLAITSDHGEELYEHGDWAHGMKLFDHQLHVPLIIRRPGGADGARQVSDLVGLLDVAPTLLALSGIAAPTTMKGRSLTPAMAEKRKSVARDAVFATGVKWSPRQAAVRTARYKLIRDAAKGTDRLYDLRKDPGEQRDVAKANPKTVAHLSALLREHQRRSSAKAKAKPERVPVDKATQERLRALGY